MRLYQAGALLTSARAQVVRDAGVLVDGSVIAAAGPLAALAAAVPPTAEVVDLGGLTLLPGLVDSHVHLGFDGGPQPVARMRAEADTEQLLLMLDSARQLLGAGVTTARDLGARSFLDVAVRDGIARGIAPGPRLLVAGRPLTPTGGHCWFMGGECDTADELRRMVRLHHKMGTDLIKVMSTGGFMTAGSAPWHAQYTEAELAAVVAEARRLGKRVAAHGHGAEGIARAVAAGVDTIEHCSFAGPDGRPGSGYDPALAGRIAAAGIYVCPTVNVRAPCVRERFGDVHRTVVTGLYERGVRLIAGTDAGIDNCPHDAYARGLEELAGLGLPAAEILEMATLRAATALGVDSVTGSLEPGKDADFIAVAGDPLRDLSALRRVALVVARGAEYRRSWRPAEPGAASGPGPGLALAAGPAPVMSAAPAAQAAPLPDGRDR